MTDLAEWVNGARPRTLVASVAPVVVGTAAAGRASVWRTLAALAVGLGLQIGVNFANDYQDGMRGIDTEERQGPPRLTSSGLASPRSVLFAALVSIAVAGVAGLALAVATSLWVIPIGAAAMLALWFYSGGPRPYGSLGLGEVMVFVFFGLMATAGTAYVQAERIPGSAWWSSAAMGFLAVAILEANNVRDISTDSVAGKRTLAVRLGQRRARALYRALVVAAFATIVLGVATGIVEAGYGLSQWALLALAVWPLAIGPVEAVGSAEGRALVPVLVGTAQLQLVFGALLALGLWLAATA
ncbi:MAG TPA: 1,4-dihydroxy-2-naphthoate polyprenyltransferase [Actinomycetota bacterium]|nr:1,4-dihydroxy-2-naphthoate polyprenyltransferase [Actinomycetota bacterium]